VLPYSSLPNRILLTVLHCYIVFCHFFILIKLLHFTYCVVDSKFRGLVGQGEGGRNINWELVSMISSIVWEIGLGQFARLIDIDFGSFIF